MYAAMATTWNILGGFTGYVSIGHSAIFGLGAYGTGLMVTRLDVPWTVATGADYLYAATSGRRPPGTARLNAYQARVIHRAADEAVGIGTRAA